MIVPNYAGCTRPQDYDLVDTKGGKRVVRSSMCQTQKEAKEAAEDIAYEEAGWERLTPAHWRLLVKTIPHPRCVETRSKGAAFLRAWELESWRYLDICDSHSAPGGRLVTWSPTDKGDRAMKGTGRWAQG